MLYQRAFSALRRVFRREHVRHEGAILPARHLRFCGLEFKDDAFFLASARKEADRLATHCGLTRDSRVLDVGCGPGRLAIGILDRIGPIRSYRGLDVDERSVRWGRRHIARTHPTFGFDRVDARNSRYNPAGERIGRGFRLPLADASCDIIYLYSVFSHMLLDDVRAYLREFARILAPEGWLFFTAFVEEGVPPVSENPSDYRREWDGPLHCVRYDRTAIAGLLEEVGMEVVRTEHGTETDGQSGLYVRRRSGA